MKIEENRDKIVLASKKYTNVGGYTIGISFVVEIETVAKFEPALDPINGIPAATRFFNGSIKFNSCNFFISTKVLPPPI